MDRDDAQTLSSGIAATPQKIGLTTKILGAAGVVSLDRPRALNALTSAMRAQMGAAFAAWSREPQVYAVVIESLADRAFCAGGDLREMVELGKAQPEAALQALAAEYALNWRLECFTKPTIALIDGMVVGSGVGITLYGTHRVAGERYAFAMPEVRIGLFPDDGVSWALARMPDEIGMYLALTGRSLGPADAYRLGLATHCIPVARFAQIKDAIANADPVDPVLDQAHEDAGPGAVEPLRPIISRCFRQDSVAGVVGALEAERGEHRGWAEGVLEDLRASSPISLKVTHRHVRSARDLDLSATLRQDFRLATRFMQGHDFYEGVRAALIDRDHAPKWQPERLCDIEQSAVDDYFTTLGERELFLSTRAEMQAIGR